LAFRILHGERAGDLTDACMEEICNEALLWPNKRAFLIVPEQTKADMERRYLEIRQKLSRSPESGGGIDEALMIVDVLSFHRFAHRVLAEIGGTAHDLPDAAMQSLLIHRVLNEGKDDFSVLSPISQRFGFASRIQNVLEDFYRYDITPEMLENIDEEASRPLFARKMRELGLLMKRLDELTERLDCCERARPLPKLCSVVDEVRKARNNGPLPWPLNRLEYLSEASIWINGFGQTRNFTPEETELIRRLSSLCAKVTVSVCADRETANRFSDSGACENCADGFYFGGQTIRLLKEAIPGAEIIGVGTGAETVPEIRHLSRSFLRRERKPFAGSAEGVTSMLFASTTEELSYIAGKIRELVLLHDYRYKDITVVLCDPESYRSNLHAVFSEFGMDPFLDKRRKLSDTALMRFVTALLDLGVNGWSYDSLMRCLKSGICHISREQSDKLENYFLRHGLFKGFRIFDEKNYATGKDTEGPEVFREVERVLLPLREAVRGLSAEPRCDRKAGLLSAFLIEYVGADADSGNGGQIELLAGEWVEAGDHDAALALVASWNELTKTLDRLAGPLGDMKISLLNFRDALVFAAEAASAGAIPAFVDQVRITDVAHGFQRDCKVLFLVGAQREYFPNTALSEGFLRGYERELLGKSLRVRFPNRAKDGAYADFFTAYAILDCPSEKFFVSGLLSKEPSLVFRLIAECLPNALLLDNPPKSLHDPRLFSANALLRHAAHLCSPDAANEDPAERHKALALLRMHPEFACDRDRPGDPFEIVLPGKLMSELLGSRSKMSVSQIEKYVSCPFQYFASYILGLAERERFEVDARETGSVTHKIMEIALDELIEELGGASGEDAREAVLKDFSCRDYQRWAEELFEKACAEEKNNVSLDPALRMGSGQRMIAIARESLRAVVGAIGAGGFIPAEAEWSYGEGKKNPPFSIEWPEQGRSVVFKGIIDRVDVNSDGVFRVLDYKTGDKRVNFLHIYSGLSVQLPAYLFAYRFANPHLMPGDAGYFVLRNPIIRVDPAGGEAPAVSAALGKSKEFSERGMKLASEDLICSSEHAMLRIRESCEKIFSGCFPVRPVYDPAGGSHACTYCEYKSVCGIDPVTPPFSFLKPLPDIDVGDGKKQTDRERYISAVRRDLARIPGQGTAADTKRPAETDGTGDLTK
jgi:ATP-dependent helicase/nuclease subunit B